jgi:hypothetical protein
VIKSGMPQNIHDKGAIGLTLGGMVLVLAGLMANLTEVFHAFLQSDQVYDNTVSSDVPHTVISFQIHTCSPSKLFLHLS